VAIDFRLNGKIQSKAGMSKNPFCHAEQSPVLGRTDRGEASPRRREKLFISSVTAHHLFKFKDASL
jgi:hypothetical protein